MICQSVANLESIDWKIFSHAAITTCFSSSTAEIKCYQCTYFLPSFPKYFFIRLGFGDKAGHFITNEWKVITEIWNSCLFTIATYYVLLKDKLFLFFCVLIPLGVRWVFSISSYLNTVKVSLTTAWQHNA